MFCGSCFALCNCFDGGGILFVKYSIPGTLFVIDSVQAIHYEYVQYVPTVCMHISCLLSCKVCLVIQSICLHY